MCMVVHTPTTPDGQRELTKRVSSAHAAAVLRHIQGLNLSNKQKLTLIDAVIKAAHKP